MRIKKRFQYQLIIYWKLIFKIWSNIFSTQGKFVNEENSLGEGEELQGILKSSIRRIKDNNYIQFILILVNYLFLLNFILPFTLERFKFINELVSRYIPWFHPLLLILFILSLFLSDGERYKFILFPVRLINIIAIIPVLYIALMYLLAMLLNLQG